jgi:sRNA-binding carbon storage regulator CsrA
MLVLGRSAGETIVVPGKITVRVSAVRDRKVFLRFKATTPDGEVSSHRWIKQGESLSFFDGEIEIVIVNARRGIASIGVLAAAGVKIIRGELE